MRSALLHQGERLHHLKYDSESVFDAAVKENAVALFGEFTLYLELEKGVPGAPRALLIDLLNAEGEQDAYLVKTYVLGCTPVEHVLTDVTKLVVGIRQPQNGFRENTLSRIQDKPNAEQDLRSLTGDSGSRLSDCLNGQWGILLIGTGPSGDLDEAAEAYEEWNNVVETFVLEKYRIGNNDALVLSPEFRDMEECIAGLADTQMKRSREDHTDKETKNQAIATETVTCVCPNCGSRMLLDSSGTFSVWICSNGNCSLSRPGQLER